MKKAHQHFIPRVYLKNFAHTSSGDTFLVDALNQKSQKLIENMSIKDVCVETDLYTLKHLGEDNKYDLEDFFSENIESKYSDVYKLLVTDKKKSITLKERTDILYTVLSMYFRTPKALNQLTEFQARMISDVRDGYQSDTIDFMGVEMNVKDKSLEEIQKELKRDSRLSYLSTQMTLLHNFVLFRAHSGLQVFEIKSDEEFLTGDNPVIIGRGEEVRFNLFDEENSILVPLDRKHALYIAPKRAGSVMNEVFYTVKDEMAVYIQNHLISQSAERWLIGTKHTIEQFLEKDAEYTKPLEDDNHPEIDKLKWKTQSMKTLMELTELDFSNKNTALLEHIKDILNSPCYKECPDIEHLLKEMKKKGISIDLD